MGHRRRRTGLTFRQALNQAVATYGPFQGHWGEYFGAGSLPVSAEVEQAFRELVEQLALHVRAGEVVELLLLLTAHLLWRRGTEVRLHLPVPEENGRWNSHPPSPQKT